MFTIRLAKDNFKFSAAHFTIFNAHQGERLHGHNYYVAAALTFAQLHPQNEMTADFHSLKAVITEECKNLDEYVLLPENSPHLRIETQKTQIQVTFHEKKYLFPREDVLLLPLLNITSEALAKYLAGRLQTRLAATLNLEKIEVTLEETRGQGASTEVLL